MYMTTIIHMTTIMFKSEMIQAVEGIRALLKKVLSLNTFEPLCHENYTQLNLVATLQSLADPLSEKDACVYFAQGNKFEFLGPLRDPFSPEETCSELMDEIREAVYTRSDIVYVSMGQITGDDPCHGWNASFGDNLLTGKQICHAIYRVMFRELGKAKVGPTPLVIFTVGKHGTREDLDLEIPENCYIVAEALVPEVQVLQAARPALFVTDGAHGYSLIDALTVARCCCFLGSRSLKNPIKFPGLPGLLFVCDYTYWEGCTCVKIVGR